MGLRSYLQSCRFLIGNLEMVMCSRCKKRMAVVFITRIDEGESKQEGICIKCAKELGIKPVNDMIEKMGLSEDDIDRMSEDMENFMDSAADMFGAGLGGELTDTDGELSDDADGRAPAINLQKLINEGLGKESDKKKSDKAEPGKLKKKKEPKYLSAYCKNLTKEAKDQKLDKVIGRERELDRVIQILCRRQKNNPCLIGEPGVGKTAIAEALSQKIASGDVPYRLKGCEVYLVDLTALVAGTQFRGQFESRVLGLLTEVKTAGNIILVIDEVHNIVGAGDAEGSMNAANILKPALSRGEIQVIGATTLNEYRKYIEKDSALERRFQPVTVNEPSMEDTENILRGIKHYYEEYHGIKIPDSTLTYAVNLSERYITDRFLPDKAIDLIDEAASHISLSSKDINRRAEAMADKARVIEEHQTAEASLTEEGVDTEAVYKKLAGLKADELRLSEEIKELDEKCSRITMTVADLASVIEIWTGIPATNITEDEFTRLELLEERLGKRIVGQDEAVSAVSKAIRRGRAGVSPKRKPVSFIFAGPTGVGKTELVKVLAKDLFSTPDNLVRLDMSEFMDKFAVSRIVGSPPGYVGYDDAGQLTEKIRRHPYSVVLFDEIEKAHPDVMNILLQILDDGRITDSHGKEVNFENTVIVMTTNAGSGGAGAPGFTGDSNYQIKDHTVKALSEFLRPEFINRVDEIITFRSLSKENFAKIAKIMMDEVKDALAHKFITLNYTDNVCRYVADKSYSVKYGARNMRRFIQREAEDKIASAIVSSRGRISQISLDSDGETLTVMTL